MIDRYPLINALAQAVFQTDADGVYALVHPQAFNFILDDCAEPAVKAWPDPPKITFANGRSCVQIGSLRIYATASYLREDSPTYVPRRAFNNNDPYWRIVTALRNSITEDYGMVGDQWIVATPAGFFVGTAADIPAYPVKEGTCWASERYHDRALTWADKDLGASLWQGGNGPYPLGELAPPLQTWAKRAISLHPTLRHLADPALTA